MMRCFFCGKPPNDEGGFDGECMKDQAHFLETPEVAANRIMNEMLARVLRVEAERIEGERNE